MQAGLTEVIGLIGLIGLGDGSDAPMSTERLRQAVTGLGGIGGALLLPMLSSWLRLLMQLIEPDHSGLGRDVFARGAPEGLRVDTKALWQASLYDLVAAYGQVKARTAPAVHVVSRRPVMSLDEAIVRVGRLVGARLDWARLESFLPEGAVGALGRSALASSFVAILELARQGRVDIRQEGMFAPIFLRAATDATGHVEA